MIWHSFKTELSKFTDSHVSSVLLPLNSRWYCLKWKAPFNLSQLTKHYSSFFFLVLAAIYIIVLVISKIFDILISTRKNGKIIIIGFYDKKFLFQHIFPYCITRSQVRFYFPWCIKFSSFICSVTSVRKHKSLPFFFVARIILPFFLSLVIEYLASISFVLRKSWTRVYSKSL